MVVGWSASRIAVDGLAELIEAVVDVHGRNLAAALGVVADDLGELTTETGGRVTRLYARAPDQAWDRLAAAKVGMG